MNFFSAGFAAVLSFTVGSPRTASASSLQHELPAQIRQRRNRRRVLASFILPHASGGGGPRPRGGKGVGLNNSHAANAKRPRPLHHAPHGPPPPLRGGG